MLMIVIDGCGLMLNMMVMVKIIMMMLMTMMMVIILMLMNLSDNINKKGEGVESLLVGLVIATQTYSTRKDHFKINTALADQNKQLAPDLLLMQ